MNVDFRAPVDIQNRALTHCGARQISATDTNDRATEVRSVYDKLRVAELRRNIWTHSTRKAILRPVTTDVLLVTFPDHSPTATYPKFMVVTDTTGRVYQAQSAQAAGDGPDDNTAGSAWTRHFGTDVAFPWSEDTDWYAGEIVYSTTGNLYLALVNGPTTDPTATIPAWAAGTYRKGVTVRHAGSDYQSDIDLNTSTPGVANWTLLSALTTQVGNRIGQEWMWLEGATYTALELGYPIDAGPSISNTGRAIFRKPLGCVREAPLAPKAGYLSPLGAPAWQAQSDWEHDDNYILSAVTGPMPYRFVADVADVLRFDPMFCELLGARIALETCERITQSSEKLSDIASKYEKFGKEARMINAIEAGPTEGLEDDWVSCRR